MLSFSVDFSTAWTMVSTLVNGLFPVYLIPLGISFGIAILGVIITAFRGMVR